MKLNKHNTFIIIILSIIVIIYINSTYWFRFKLANYYKKEQQLEKAIDVYRSILRKDNIKNKLREWQKAKIYFDLGNLYAHLNFVNEAIESYAKGSKYSLDIKTDQYHKEHIIKRNFNKDILLGIGFLEGGKLDRALKEFIKSEELFSPCPNIDPYIAVTIALKEKNMLFGNKDFFFLLGDMYVQHGLYDVARNFFTKRILDYGIDLFEVLSYLKEKYSKNIEIKNKIWGNEIYVTLEDFETNETKFVKWLNTLGSKINSHYIENDIFYKGYHSEWFDITYKKERKDGDFDFYGKNLKIFLKKNNLILGLRLFIKSIKPSSHLFGLNVLYQKEGKSGVYVSAVRQEVAGEWEKYRIENLFGAAESLAIPRNWSMDGAFIDKIVIDTKGISNKFFIDEIELYLITEQ